MHLLVGLLLLIIILELAAGCINSIYLRKTLAAVVGVFIAVDSLLIVCLRPSVWAILLAYLSAFRVINLLKLIDGRKQPDYLRSSFLRSSLSLVGYQAGLLVLTWLVSDLSFSFNVKWIVAICISLLGLITIAMSLRRGLIKSRPTLGKLFAKESDLPSITVAIPARNETVDLEECLGSLIGSDYPKMEILVLDDCSKEKRTPEIIRSFAQSGVRFLSGAVPAKDWTAKNYAYEQLAKEANGQVIVFCGVDVRFDRQTLSKMIEIKLAKNKKMISFMPLNIVRPPTFKALLLQPVRYLWELGIPRRFLGRPPVLSSCWLIDRQELISSGGFKAVSGTIIPERYFARASSLSNDGYSFIALGGSLGLTSLKGFDEQLQTAIRTKYPLLKQRLEHVAVLTLIEFILFLSPTCLFIYELQRASLVLAFLNAINIVLASLVIFRITKLAYNKTLLLSFIVFPLVIAYDIALYFYSMIEYEFGEVVWKGRNVCIPVMQIVKGAKS